MKKSTTITAGSIIDRKRQRARNDVEPLPAELLQFVPAAVAASSARLADAQQRRRELEGAAADADAALAAAKCTDQKAEEEAVTAGRWLPASKAARAQERAGAVWTALAAADRVEREAVNVHMQALHAAEKQVDAALGERLEQIRDAAKMHLDAVERAALAAMRIDRVRLQIVDAPDLGSLASRAWNDPPPEGLGSIQAIEFLRANI